MQNKCAECAYFQRFTNEAALESGTCHCAPPLVASYLIPVQGLRGAQPQTLHPTYRPQVRADDLACREFKPSLVS